jgi:hypothetical protein
MLYESFILQILKSAHDQHLRHCFCCCGHGSQAPWGPLLFSRFQVLECEGSGLWMLALTFFLLCCAVPTSPHFTFSAHGSSLPSPCPHLVCFRSE